MSKDLEVPEEEFEDYAHAAIKSAIGVIPIGGGILQEVFSSVFEAPLSKRKTKWMRLVVEVLRELEEKSLKVDELRENEQFISAVFYASHLAMKTHHEEKLQALKNAIMNIAEGVESDEALQQIFFNYVDQFTLLHLKILRFAKSPEIPTNWGMGGFDRLLYLRYPELEAQSDIVMQVWGELFRSGLVTSERIGISIYGGRAEAQTSRIGNRFLNFITGD